MTIVYNKNNNIKPMDVALQSNDLKAKGATL